MTFEGERKTATGEGATGREVTFEVRGVETREEEGEEEEYE